MKSTSIAAYELPARVASYDADMDVMHPNRHKMVSVALETLPFDASATVTALDLGTGTGFFTHRFLERFPEARVISVDGSNSMVDLAQTRLGPLAARVDFRIGDFRRLQDLIPESTHGDAVFSSYALHHLNHAEKREVIRQALRFLKPGGWLINADIVTHDDQDVGLGLVLRLDHRRRGYEAGRDCHCRCNASSYRFFHCHVLAG
jgi:ubiquinone/menaquinone biosynthesis C-methylase UbiE